MIRQCGKRPLIFIIFLVIAFIIVEKVLQINLKQQNVIDVEYVNTSRFSYLNNKESVKYDNVYNSCDKLSLTEFVRRNTSLCSIRATERGFGQKILSISIFGPTENPKMFSINNSLILLHEFLNEMKQVYADNWILRVYHNNVLDQTIISYFERRYAFVDFCNITNLCMDFVPPKIWRFLPAGDNTVSVMASRDLDSPLTQREKAAMNEWLLSNLTFHSMRDHYYHVVPMLGGMWAYRVENDRKFSSQILSKILDRGLISRYSLNRDQQFVNDHIWPYAREHTMTHDSFFCTNPAWNKHHRPFPTQRPARNASNYYCYIGCPKPCCTDWYFDRYHCPVACRPKEHQDWTYC